MARKEYPRSLEKTLEYNAAKRTAAKARRNAEARQRLKENPGAIRGKDGRVIAPKHSVGPCKRCQKEFSFVMTTRPIVICDECKPIIAQEKQLRGKLAERLRKARRKTATKRRPLIRYAGYDPSERHEEYDYDCQEESRTSAARCDADGREAGHADQDGPSAG